MKKYKKIIIEKVEEVKEVKQVKYSNDIVEVFNRKRTGNRELDKTIVYDVDFSDCSVSVAKNQRNENEEVSLNDNIVYICEWDGKNSTLDDIRKTLESLVGTNDFLKLGAQALSDTLYPDWERKKNVKYLGYAGTTTVLLGQYVIVDLYGYSPITYGFRSYIDKNYIEIE